MKNVLPSLKYYNCITSEGIRSKNTILEKKMKNSSEKNLKRPKILSTKIITWSKLKTPKRKWSFSSSSFTTPSAPIPTSNPPSANIEEWSMDIELSQKSAN